MNKPFFRTSKGTWYAWIQGTQRSLGVKGEENEAQAIEQWHRLVAEGPKPKAEAKPEAQSVKELIEAFLADAEPRVKPNTLRTYARFLEPFAKRYGTKKAKDITATEAHAFAFKPTWGNSTRHDALTSLATAFRWGKKPLAGLRIPPKESRGMEAVIPEADAFRIIAKARGDMKPLLRFLWLTGCRPSEAMGLQAEMIDEASSIVILKDHKTARATGKPSA